jgi:hypothetical protein
MDDWCGEGSITDANARLSRGQILLFAPSCLVEEGARLYTHLQINTLHRISARKLGLVSRTVQRGWKKPRNKT